MQTKIKTVSDVELGTFILSCMDTVREIEDMCDVRCVECKEPLTDDEIKEARENGINRNEVVCDDCWIDFLTQKLQETKHPDER